MIRHPEKWERIKAPRWCDKRPTVTTTTDPTIPSPPEPIQVDANGRDNLNLSRVGNAPLRQ